MSWLPHLCNVLGGALLANAVPHMVSGMTGRPFQTPFAKPPGQGLSSSAVNVLWGSFNIIVGYVLICCLGDFDLRKPGDVLLCGAGALVVALFCARHFGRLHGGNAPEHP